MSMEHPVVQLLSDLVALPSVNPEREVARTDAPFGEGRMADYVEHYFQRLGVRVGRQAAFAGRDSVLVLVPGQDPRAAPILLEAHMDTVGVAGMEGPFAPRLDGGRLYGRGACDTKATLAAMMLALRELLEAGAPLRRGVCLVGAADEEFSQTGVQRLVESGMAFSAAIVGEPTGLRIVSAHNGQVYFKIVAHGKAAHTSNPQFGVNAIYTMTDVINVLRHGVGSTYPFRRHALCGTPQLTVSLIQGGSSEHVVPESCEASLDRRIIPGETWSDAAAEIKGWLAARLDAQTLQRIDVKEPYHIALPLDTPVDHALVRGLYRVAESVLGAAQIAGVPYNTDATHLSAAGVPTVVFGPGDIAQAHTTNEWVEVDQVIAAVEILKRFLVEGMQA
jgi:succinyl-diaminopimelate desuccinylase